jgi:hypothetical protein
MPDKPIDNAGESRREFLKKAGAVAWVVPTMQVVNMAAAGAQTSGSIVTTTPGPSTTTTTTTEAPGCTRFRVCRIKADWTGNGWKWDEGVGANDCIQDGDFEKCLGSEIGAEISGDERRAVVTVSKDCEITRAAHKAGQACIGASVTNGGRTATFTASPQDISHVELIVKCCIDEN